MTARTIEAWMWRDPAEVVERIELQANAAASREMKKLDERLAKRAEQERIKALVFKKARAG